MEAKMTNKAIQQMDERFNLQHEALDIFRAVVSEWKSDPTSVQCFDLRIVERALYIDARLKEIDPFYKEL